MEKLWQGRFQEKSEHWVDEFGASIPVDYQLANEDITGSLAHVAMLGKCQIISVTEQKQIEAGLKKILADIQAGNFEFKLADEDIHLNIEKQLHQEIGEVAGKLHTARSRNDQVATDMHLYLKKQVVLISEQIKTLRKVLVELSSQHVETLMPGFTHLQHAQPISFAHHLMAYDSMFKRDGERFQFNLKHIDISPLGCAALAGTTFPIDRAYTAELLGFSEMYTNSLDGVSDRDFIIEFLSNASLLIMHLSRLCEEIILWSSHEFQFIELADSYSTGSSIMPQKKNPDMAELIRGKTGRVYGHLFSLLTTLKGLPLAYNKDMQEDKEGMFDTVKTIQTSLKVMTGMLATMTVKTEKMAASTHHDYSNATELADYLADKGMPFRQAHELVGQLVYHCIQTKQNLQDISLAEYQTLSPLIESDIYQALEPLNAMNRRNSAGGTGMKQVQAAIHQASLELELTS